MRKQNPFKRPLALILNERMPLLAQAGRVSVVIRRHVA